MTFNPITMCAIDDIEDVLEGIEVCFKQPSYGVNLIGTASNGEEGLRLILAHKPDIVITDIRMPLLDGLEMIKKVLPEHPHCKIIFITGFTDFEYAQQAVKLGAFDFVTKPFSLEELVDVVDRAKTEREKELASSEHYLRMEAQMRQSLPLLRQEFFQLLLRHPMKEESARKRWDFLDIELDSSGLVVLSVEIDDFAKTSAAKPVQEIELERFAIQNIVEETIMANAKGFVFRDGPDRFVAIMNADSDEEASRIAERCREHVLQYAKFSVSLGLGRQVPTLLQLPLSYEQAITALSYRFYTQGNTLLRFDDFEPMSMRSTLRLSSDKERELFLSIASGNAMKALEVLDEILDEFRQPELTSRLEPQLVKSAFLEIAFMMIRALTEKVPYEELSALDRQAKGMVAREKASVHEMLQLLQTITNEGCSLVQQRQSSNSQGLIDKAVDYLKSNLHKELTVQECAKLVHLSPSYFFSLFKKTTGVTFAQYVIHERMEKAKSLLVDGLQVQEICCAVGYEDRRYFSELFKKHTGLTPTEFKQAYFK